ALALAPSTAKPLLWTLIAVIAVASATQDIAIDALAIRITPEKLLGIVTSIRVAAYRGAMIVAGAGLALLTAVTGWRVALLAGAAITAAALALTTVLPSETGFAKHRGSPFAGVAHWLTQPRAALFLAIAFLYKLGDVALAPMAKILWKDRGFSTAEVGAVGTGVGMAFLIAGVFVGGVFVTRFGIYRGLLWLGVAQMISNVGYALLAASTAGRPAFYTVGIIEYFTGGLGTTAFLAFLMAICDREFAATQYAMLSAVFALSRSLAGTASGWAVDRIGYVSYFWITVALALPGLALGALLRNVPLVAPSREELVDV
ncbi:MAG TPA: MFS transporter, partial [Thermoanaerobaculia bacterium]|nr:MFS transporter [Thermoanaerobaculia bacterium]